MQQLFFKYDVNIRGITVHVFTPNRHSQGRGVPIGELGSHLGHQHI